MTKSELNEYHTFVIITWNNKRQPGIFHTIQDALIEISKITHFNTTGKYHIITRFCKYEVTDLFKMKLKKVQIF